MIARWRRYINNPIIIGSIISVLVIFLLAKFLPFYITEKMDESVVTNQGEVYFFDLNEDGTSEKINYYHYERVFQPTMYLYDSNDKLITLWNFSELPVKNHQLFVGDYNSDQQNELYVFTRYTDSIFLYVLPSEKILQPIVDRKFITVLSDSDSSLHINTIGLYNLDNQENKEFLFAVNAGFPSSPRKIFALYLDSRDLKSSPEINADICNPIIVEDINNDQVPEIMVSNHSVEIAGKGNISKLLVLDYQLNYLFPPKDYLGGSSKISVDIIEENKQKYLAVLRSGSTDQNIFNDLMIYNSYGEKINEKKLNLDCNYTILPVSDSHAKLHLFSGKSIKRYSHDLKMEESKKISNDELCFVDYCNLVGNNKKEYIFKNKHSLVIASNNFRHTTSFKLGHSDKFIFTKLTDNFKVKALSVQSGNNWSLYKLHENKAFFYGSIFYLLIFIAITFITFFLSKLNLRVNKLNESIIPSDEKDFILEVEENLKEKFTNLKSKVDKIGEEKDGSSYKRIIHEIDHTYKEIKTISDKYKDKEPTKKDIKLILKDLIHTKKGHIDLKFFSDSQFSSLTPELNKLIEEICSEIIDFILQSLPGESVSLQLVEHAEYIGLLFEIENSFINPKEINQDTAILNGLKSANASWEISNVNNFGSVIDVSIPTINKKQEQEESKNGTRVIIAEDHDVSLFGLVSLFKTKDDIEIVATAKNGMEVLKQLETEQADVVITDISMPGMDGIELTEKLNQQYPEIKVIVFTMYMENWFVEQLVKNNAKGFVSKNSSTKELIYAVRTVMEGNNYYCPQFKSKFGFKGNNNGIKQKLDSLSKNELRIVKQYAKNLSKEQIANEMALSPHAIDHFVANILIKLNAGDEEEIIRIAKKQRFVKE